MRSLLLSVLVCVLVSLLCAAVPLSAAVFVFVRGRSPASPLLLLVVLLVARVLACPRCLLLLLVVLLVVRLLRCLGRCFVLVSVSLSFGFWSSLAGLLLPLCWLGPRRSFVLAVRLRLAASPLACCGLI